MSDRATLAWLAAFQERFGQVLRTPLDRSTRTLRARLDAYSDEAIADLEPGPNGATRERMAVYNRQYWFRLFGVLQREFRLTARLMGMWTFNGHASRFLERHPPRDHDIQRAGDGFAKFLLTELDDASLREATRIDQAFRTVLAAPAQEPFVIDAAQASRLASARLLPAPTWVLVSESRPLVALRQQLAGDEGEGAVPVPDAYAEEHDWVVFVGPRGHGAVPLEPVRARLLHALREYPVGEALARVEQAASPSEREVLLANAQAWLADSVQRGFWRAVE